jgi:hypothetical protein
MKEFDKLLREYINTLNFDTAPTPTNVHPYINDALTELEMSSDFGTLWAERLSDLEQVMRQCLAKEVKESLMPNLPANVAHTIDPYLIPMLHYAISAAWLVHRQVVEEWGDTK